jgi:hypothetical protein
MKLGVGASVTALSLSRAHPSCVAHVSLARLFGVWTPRLSPLWTAPCCGPSARPPSRTSRPPRPLRWPVTCAVRDGCQSCGHARACASIGRAIDKRGREKVGLCLFSSSTSLCSASARSRTPPSPPWMPPLAKAKPSRAASSTLPRSRLAFRPPPPKRRAPAGAHRGCVAAGRRRRPEPSRRCYHLQVGLRTC